MSRLTEPEQQKTIHSIETDERLPDSFQISRFVAEREVEVAHNRMTNEIRRILSPFQTMEQQDKPWADNAGRHKHKKH